MSETASNVAQPNLKALSTPALQVVTRMLRSPSHESMTTDLSLFSVSTFASNAKYANRLASFKSYSDVQLSARGTSPNPDTRQTHMNRPPDIPEIIWFEEENELIRSCNALSSALGLQKSFSTGDVSQLSSPESLDPRIIRPAVSALALDAVNRTGFLLEQARLEHASRSCSTWVAVGDLMSTSQLPSPHGSAISQPPVNTLSLRPPQIPFTTADLVRSVNKKVRQHYIRRRVFDFLTKRFRLLTTYRALERLSQSEFNLDRLEAAATAAHANLGSTLIVPVTTSTSSSTPTRKEEKEHVLTVKDVEIKRGKQLSKYERNMMIFDWLHAIDPSVEETMAFYDILNAQTSDHAASMEPQTCSNDLE